MPSSRLPRPPAVARVLQQVTATARRHGMFEPGGVVLVAVSGGPDSLCLLHALVRLRRLLQISPVCFHFDHGLREGSAADAAYVRGQARRLGVPFALRRADSRPGRGESIEAWARTVRYAALTSVAEERGSAATAVGHTADDQAETVLLALVRGGGLEAVSGMSPVSRPIVRPLLETTRSETERFCRSLRLRPRRDPMNEDPSFLRVSVRTSVIPLLEERVGRGVRTTLARSAALLRADAELLDRMADAAAARVLSRDGAGTLLSTEALAREPEPIASRVVRRAILSHGVVPESEHVGAVLGLASSPPGRRRSLPGGLRARRERGYVRLSRPSPEARR